MLTLLLQKPLFTNDAVILGLLMAVLAFIFVTKSSPHPFWQKFYIYVPSLLLCYFLPSLLATFNIIDGQGSNLYFVASRYLLPTSLILLTLSIDLPEIMKLGPKALVMFFTATLGIVIGGPLAIIIVNAFSPEMVGQFQGELWRGMATVAGSWIGGGANQAAMKEIFEVDNDLFAVMLTVDVLVANVWLAILLYGASRYKEIDRKVGADNSAIEELKDKIAAYRAETERIAQTSDLMAILGVGFFFTALAHWGADLLVPWISTEYPFLDKYSLTKEFFWIVVIATTAGVVGSFTGLRHLESVGASKMGSVFLYVLVATIGMKMNLAAILENLELFVIGFIWIAIHAVLLITVGRLIRAPFFFLAVGSQANVGGAASAPIVASAIHPVLAPVGVLLAVLGYALGTYAAILCAHLMRLAGG